jgi:PHD/YefM family antitoxin component YafN of YafNO toxin-antitoxin module
MTFQEILESVEDLSTEEQNYLMEFIQQQQDLLQQATRDDTGYLLRSQNNADHLQRSIEQFRAGKTFERNLVDG